MGALFNGHAVEVRIPRSRLAKSSQNQLPVGEVVPPSVLTEVLPYTILSPRAAPQGFPLSNAALLVTTAMLNDSLSGYSVSLEAGHETKFCLHVDSPLLAVCFRR